MQVYNKLVRDKIPEIIVSNGEKPIIQILDDKKYRFHLEQKLNEEVNEYHESKCIEELADILEVVYALCEMDGYTQDDLIADNSDFDYEINTADPSYEIAIEYRLTPNGLEVIIPGNSIKEENGIFNQIS